MKKVISLFLAAIMIASLMASAAVHIPDPDCCQCCLNDPEVPCLEQEHCDCGGRPWVITPFCIGDGPPQEPA